MAELFELDSIKQAAALLHNVDNPHFTPSFAIFAATQDETLAADPLATKATKVIQETMELRGEPRATDLKERAYQIMKAKALPRLKTSASLASVTLSDFRTKKLADAMRLAGYKQEDTVGSGAKYKACLRYCDRRQKEDKQVLSAEVLKRPEVIVESSAKPPPVIDVESTTPSSVPTLSPLSTSQASTSQASSETSLASKPKAVATSSRSEFAKKTTLSPTRRTVHEIQAARAEDVTWDDTKRVAYKCGTTMLSEVQRGRFALKKFGDAEKIAIGLNEFLECQVLTGEELIRSVRSGRVGKSPQRRGPRTRISDDDFELVCELVFTCQSIEQANCDPNRLDRPRMRSAISEVVNAKLLESKQDPLENISFYRRIETTLSTTCKLASPNYREALRAAWLTWNNQVKNYEQWEFWCVELGFGRFPNDEEERAAHGNVVFHEGQKRRIIQFDEMGFSLDGKKNGKGGRPAALPTNTNIPEPSRPTSHSSQKVTCLFGMNYEGEAIPPIFVVASSAEAPKIRTQFVRYMKQIKGQFGFPPVEGDTDLRAFSAGIAFSKDGSIDTESMIYFAETHLRSIYPDAEDTAGKRVLLKADLGPGRWSTVFRYVAKSYGIYFFPGLPNGTELGQEMDQLFALIKSIMERNREQLWNARFVYEQSRARTTTWDLPWIVFGGRMQLDNGSTMELRNAFNEGLNSDRIHRAMEKCGYVPATRELLNSELLLREICEDPDLDEQNKHDDVYTRMMIEIERKNHDVVKNLTSRGYVLAQKLKRYVRRAAKQYQSSKNEITVPNTRRRQEKLVGIRQGGEWFQVTNGGAPLNCDDAIIALEIEHIAQQKKKMEKFKKETNTRRKEIDEAEAVMEAKGRDYNPEFKMDRKRTKYIPNWTLVDLKTMIKWKAPKQSNLPTDRDGLVSVWKEVKDLVAPSLEQQWTKEDEDELAKFEDNGRYTIERTYIMRRAEQRKRETLSLQLASVKPETALKVVGCFIQSLSESDRQELFSSWEGYNLDDDYSQSTVSSVGDIEVHGRNDDSDSIESIIYDLCEDYGAMNPFPDEESDTASSVEDYDDLLDAGKIEPEEQPGNAPVAAVAASAVADEENASNNAEDKQEQMQKRFSPRGCNQEKSKKKEEQKEQEMVPVRRSNRRRKKKVW